MTDIRMLSRSSGAELYEALRFDPELEARALRHLSELDLERCRATYGELVDRLDLSRVEQVPAILLLLDVLLRVNRRVHRPQSDADAHEQHRAALIERFAALRQAEDARHAFMACLNDLLAPLGRRTAAPHGLVERAQTFIEENYQRRVSLSRVAEHVNASPNYLSRIFKRETGITLTHYMHTVRLEHARMLMAAGERSISEIAYLVGYQNYRDFYRNFVKYLKASPREVRSRLAPSDSRDDGETEARGASR